MVLGDRGRGGASQSLVSEELKLPHFPSLTTVFPGCTRVWTRCPPMGQWGVRWETGCSDSLGKAWSTQAWLLPLLPP